MKEAEAENECERGGRAAESTNSKREAKVRGRWCAVVERRVGGVVRSLELGRWELGRGHNELGAAELGINWEGWARWVIRAAVESGRSRGT